MNWVHSSLFSLCLSENSVKRILATPFWNPCMASKGDWSSLVYEGDIFSAGMSSQVSLNLISPIAFFILLNQFSASWFPAGYVSTSILRGFRKLLISAEIRLVPWSHFIFLLNNIPVPRHLWILSMITLDVPVSLSSVFWAQTYP